MISNQVGMPSVETVDIDKKNPQSANKHKSRHYAVDIILNTCEDSTTHGLNPIVKRHNPVIRTVWILCLLASSIVCSFMITKSIMSYFDYETVTKTNRINLISADFPAVTICNVNPFVTNVSAQFVEDIMRTNGLIDPRLLNPADWFKDWTAFDLMNVRYFANTNALDNSTYSDAFRQSFGYPLSDMLLSCSYNYADCSLEDDWIWFYDVIYGNCYTFNSG